MKTTDTAVKFLIWSKKWQSWYRPESAGYTINPDVAGRYTQEYAERCSKSCHGEVVGYAENSRFVKTKRKAYMEQKERDLWRAMQTMTPMQAEELTYKMVRERSKLWEQGGI